MKSLIIITALGLTACASPEYAQYAKSSEASSVARSQALATIAQQGDTAAVAAVMALALGAGQSQLQAPPQNQALSWAQVLVPGLTSIAGMRYQYMSTVAQSNNAAATAQSTNATFGNIAGLIQAPTITLSGSGTLGSGDYTPPSVISPTIVQPVTPIVPTVIQPTVITPVIQAPQ